MRTEYCTKCGTKCIQKKYISGYDSVTGEPEYEYKIQCPIYLTWNWGAWNHTNYKTGDAE